MKLLCPVQLAIHLQGSPQAELKAWWDREHGLGGACDPIPTSKQTSSEALFGHPAHCELLLVFTAEQGAK